MGTAWLTNLFLEQDARNLFFDDPYPIYADEPYFETGMLPPAWLGLYRSMSSFVITERSYYSPLGWLNTPLPRALDTDEYCKQTDSTKAAVRAFEKRLEVTMPGALRCWLLTDAQDSLWIDQQHNDRKVYHVRAGAFSEARVLPDPDKSLDEYLALVVAGGRPEEFDFRTLG